ncbi:adenosylcobinamide kinase/adenosylcobinamide-phosphate guanylyltransferase [Allostreptomyces psammosilenae]|uniref:Adenosylcobinamide kinase n=1 Tax=Allostreptomyces psammosilenae TaxID=1892865 RepID=A0A852ZXT6_9ACTN|nr:adenosylcobinamide kinase/adenosylcobinamide-phosphate guanylyltransferase [Allostreptomyces psammosilenae]
MSPRHSVTGRALTRHALTAGAARPADRVGPPAAAGRRTLVLGGARSGKSTEAERLLWHRRGVLYVATSGRRDGDAEWAERVRLHRERRPAGWATVETCDLEPLLAADGGPLLVDCLALWLTTVMDEAGAWDDGRWRSGPARAEVAARVGGLVAGLRRTRRRVVLVSNEVGSGVVPATPAGRRFRDELGRLNAAVADACEDVRLVVAGQVLPLRATGPAGRRGRGAAIPAPPPWGGR